MSSAKKDHPRAVKRKALAAPVDPELSEFSIIPQQIGKGSYSSIWVARSKVDPSLRLAVKVSRKNGKRAKLNYHSAVGALRRLSHPNIIRLFYAQETSLNYYEFLELIEEPAVTLTHMMQKAQNALPSESLHPIISQLASALAHMHGRGVGHRDIKPDNLMIHPETLHLTLIDFGFAVSSLDLCEDFVGSPIFAAPELLSFLPYRVDLADLWSLGVVIFQMCFGSFPFPAQTLEELTSRVTRENLKMPQTASHSIRELQPIITSLLQKDPTRRLSAASLAASIAPFEAFRKFTPNTEVEMEDDSEADEGGGADLMELSAS